jgi:hypothetical protein
MADAVIVEAVRSAIGKRTEAEFSTLLSSADATEGPLAFAEKRPAIWKAR